MSQFNIAEAKAQFSTLVKKAMLGEEIIIAKDNRPLLKLTPIEPLVKKSREPGSGKHLVIYMADDFDDTPDDFAEYM